MMFLKAFVRSGFTKILGKVEKEARKEVPIDIVVERLKIFGEISGTRKQIDKQELNNKYLDFFRERKFLTSKKFFETFIGLESKYPLVLFTKKQIAANKALNYLTLKLTHNFFQFCVLLYFHYLQPEQRAYLQKNIENFKEIIIAINQFYFLLEPEFQLSLKFTKCFLHYSKYKFLTEFELLNNYRLFIILVQRTQKIRDSELIQLYYFFSNSNFMFRGFDQYFQIFSLLWSRIKYNISRYSPGRRVVLISSIKLNWYSKSLIEKTQDILFDEINEQSHRQYGNLTHTLTDPLILLLKFQRITKDNYKSQKYTRLLDYIIQQNKRQGKMNYLFSNCLRLFLYSRIWFPKFWINYFESLDKEKIDQKDIHLIFLIRNSLKIFEDEVPQQIIKASSIIQKITSKYPSFESHEIIKDFQDKQVNTAKGLASQIQVANAIRLFSKYKVRTEVFVDIFSVDILVENKFIIEVNGGQHFLYDVDNRVKVYDLKTKFKAAYFNKLGYSILDLDVIGSTQSSFHFTKLIFGWIKNSQNQINWTPIISSSCIQSV